MFAVCIPSGAVQWGVNRDDFQELAELRLSEGQVLFDAGFYSGAYYLTGYAIECALKACICKKVQQYDFPPGSDLKKSHYSHNFKDLVNTSGLKNDLDQKSLQDIAFAEFWKVVIVWNELKRYEYGVADKDARDLLDAVRGILPWIQQYW